MKDFKGKIIKVILESNSGVICMTGPFVKCEDNFLAILNTFTKRIEYYSITHIKSITIIGDIEPGTF